MPSFSHSLILCVAILAMLPVFADSQELPSQSTPRTPEWFPLPEGEAKQLDELLVKWDEKRSKSVAFRCKFKQWEFDPVFRPRDATTPNRYSEGEYLTYGSQDWSWKEEIVREYVARSNAEYKTGTPQYWARNKSTLFELDYRNRRLIERKFSDEGNLTIQLLPYWIVSYPINLSYTLPRLDPPSLKDRFWIRNASRDHNGPTHELELFPKKPVDARLFSPLIIRIAESDWEVEAVDILAPNYSAKSNPAHTEIAFTKRTPLKSPVPNGANGNRCDPSLPDGWKRIAEAISR